VDARRDYSLPPRKPLVVRPGVFGYIPNEVAHSGGFVNGLWIGSPGHHINATHVRGDMDSMLWRRVLVMRAGGGVDLDVVL